MLKTASALWAAILGIGITATMAGCGGGGAAAPAAPIAQQPRILSVSANTDPEPASSSTATIEVQFDMPMDTASVNSHVHVYRGDTAAGQNVGGSGSWNQDNTMMTFTPDQPMMAGATHTVHFDAGIMGASDGHMMGGGHMMSQDVMHTIMLAPSGN